MVARVFLDQVVQRIQIRLLKPELNLANAHSMKASSILINAREVI